MRIFKFYYLITYLLEIFRKEKLSLINYLGYHEVQFVQVRQDKFLFLSFYLLVFKMVVGFLAAPKSSQ